VRRTEAALCTEFVEKLEPGWTVYPETCDWDLLLVLTEPQPLTSKQRRVFGRRVDVQRLEPGTQIGIEAKLRANCTVLRQALPCRYTWKDIEEQQGPDFRAVLLPKAGADFGAVADALNIVVLSMEPKNSWQKCPASELEAVLWHRTAWPHADREELPDIVPDVPAGVPSPVKLTRWKLGAIKLSMRLRHKGYLVRADFKEFGVDPGRWYNDWLQPGGKVPKGRGLRWVAAPGWTPFDELHPGAVAQLEEQGLGERIRGG
jgi:hypothetical protein